MQATQYQLFYSPKDRLRLTVNGEKSYPTVKPVWASPLTYPNRYLSLLNAKGEEIAMLSGLEALDADSRSAVTEELSRRYLTARVESVESARSEFGVTYWHVQTDRGERDFVTQSLQENAQWLSERHLLLIDVDGNRFEIPDVSALAPTSRAIVEQTL